MEIAAFFSIGAIAEGITFGKKKGISMRAIYLFIIFLLLISGCKKQVGNALGDDADMLTEKQLLEIANKAAKSSDGYIEGMIPYYDVDNRQWEIALAQFKKDNPDDYESIKRITADRCYLAVFYKTTNAYIIDGTFWILVDKKTGKIIIECHW